MTFIKGDIKIPDRSYLVFVFQNNKTQTISSSDIELTNNKKEFFFGDHCPIEAEVNVERLELRIDNKLINNVRWFDVIQYQDKYKIKPKKYNSIIRFIDYLFSILSLGIYTFFLLKKKNQELLRISSNWEEAQKELCDLAYWESYGQEVKSAIGDRDLRQIKRINKVIDIDADISCTEELKEKYINFSNLNKVLNQLINSQETLTTKLNALGTEEDIKHALKLKSEFGQFQFLQKRIEFWRDLERKSYRLGDWDFDKAIRLKDEYGNLGRLKDDLKNLQELTEKHGSLETIYQKLQNLKELDFLRNEVEKQNEREERWKALTGGKDIDYLEKLKSNKENENRIQKGRDFEDEIKEYFDDISNSGLDTDVEWKRQEEKDKSRLDFFVRFKNKQNKHFKVVIECKQQSVYKEELNKLIGEQQPIINKKDFKTWVEQLCKYYEKTDSNLGLLVINSDYENIAKLGVKRITYDDFPSDYREKYMNLLLVHASSLKTVLIILQYLNKSFEPETIVNYEIKKEYYSDPDMKRFILQITKNRDSLEKIITFAIDRAGDVRKNSEKFIKYLNNIKEMFKEEEKTLNNFKLSMSFYNPDIKLLDGSNNEAVIEAEEE